MENTKFHEGLSALGKSAETNAQLYADTQNKESDPRDFLESFPSPAKSTLNPSGAGLTLHIEIPEFTSLCPMTGQPDFAKIIIDYTPDKSCVESKSLKLYMAAFRNQRDFHESCVVKICNDLIALLEPMDIVVKGEFTPRGGIPFWPTAWYNKLSQRSKACVDFYQEISDII